MTKKRICWIVLSFLAIIILGGIIYFNSLLPIITGYAAKNLASAVFIQNRQQSDAESIDLNFSFIKYTKNKVNYFDKSVTSRFLWRKSKAIYRDGFGVTLLRDIKEKNLREKTYPGGTDPVYSQDTILWPLGNIIPDTITGIDQEALNIVAKRLINENGYNGNAFAFIVLHKGIPVAEAYKPQFDMKTRFLSWSMAKSFTNAIVGTMMNAGMIDIFKPTGIREWKKDDRKKITMNDLMQMQSGLEWNEDYGNRSSVNVMLHCEGDMAMYAIDQPYKYPAGTHWYYSSGGTNIVNWLIRKQFKNDSLYYSFVDIRFFNKIGMPDAVFEVDPSGTRIGSSYLYATARDYARFGLLFQNDGVFNGERILPNGWVGYSTAPAVDSKGEYGAFFWLNKSKKLPSVPEDMYMCNGHDGQRIFIIPSKELVVVVLGYSPTSKEGWILTDC